MTGSDKYLASISGHKILTLAEEKELAERIHGPNKKTAGEAFRTLVACNLLFAASIALAWQRPGIELDDIIGEANIGLCKAAERFKPKGAAKFTSYAAFYIKSAIGDYFRNGASLIRVPVHTARKISGLRGTARSLGQELNRTPELAEIADATGLKERKIRQTLARSPEYIPLDAPRDGSELTLADILPDKSKLACEETQTREELKELHALLKTLPVREKAILEARFGLDGKPAKTLAAAGRKYGLTKQRVRQIQNQSLITLRQRLERGQS